MLPRHPVNEVDEHEEDNQPNQGIQNQYRIGPNIRPHDAKAQTRHGHRQRQDTAPTQTAKPGSQPDGQKVENRELNRWPRQIISGYRDDDQRPQNKRINILKWL